MTETVVQKLRNFLQLQPVLVMATKAPIYGEGFTGNDFQSSFTQDHDLPM
jgi:DNA-repair protein XRCC2